MGQGRRVKAKGKEIAWHSAFHLADPDGGVQERSEEVVRGIRLKAESWNVV